MSTILRKSGLFIFLLFFLVLGINAQQNRFIYIQTENRQPFYVKMDKKILSSSSSGYIIIPKLVDSTYNISFGFPKDEWPEQNVTVSVDETDAGYLLKNFPGRGWGLSNLQTMQVIMPEKTAPNKNALESALNEDPFSEILSAVVNDPSIRQQKYIGMDTVQVDKPPANTGGLKPVIIKEVTVLKDTVLADKPITGSEELKPLTKTGAEHIEEQKKLTTEIYKVEISKLKADTAADGMRMAYLDVSNLGTDTVNIFIPSADTVRIITTKLPLEKPKTIFTKAETKPKNSRFIDMELPNPNIKTNTDAETDHIRIIPQKETATKELPVTAKDSSANAPDTIGSMINPECKNFASHEDFLELRKSMAAEKNDEEMKNAASKKFRSTCFTTEQIKNLGALFIKDEEKFKFYVASYPFVSDSHNFGLLQKELTDDYYITKFNAMLHH